MENKLTAEERMNYDSYSTGKQLDLYDTDKLYPHEEIAFDLWLPKERKKILDLGCGTGRTTIHLHNRGHEVIGIDYVPGMIERARAKYPGLDFRVMNACALEFPDNSFDIVIFSFNGLDCIYPIEKRWQAVAEIRRVLKPNGLYIMSSHNSIVWPANRYHLFWWFLNIVSGKIFTPFRLEYKQYRQGAKFIYFARRPSRQVKDMAKRGFELLDIFANPKRKFFKETMARTKSPLLIDLFEAWPYFVFRKK